MIIAALLVAAQPVDRIGEYRDLALRLVGVSDGGPEEWRRLLSAHFEGCPQPG